MNNQIIYRSAPKNGNEPRGLALADARQRGLWSPYHRFACACTLLVRVPARLAFAAGAPPVQGGGDFSSVTRTGNCILFAEQSYRSKYALRVRIAAATCPADAHTATHRRAVLAASGCVGRTGSLRGISRCCLRPSRNTSRPSRIDLAPPFFTSPWPLLKCCPRSKRFTVIPQETTLIGPVVCKTIALAF